MEMARRFYDGEPPASMRAHMALLEGEPIALAGVRAGLDRRPAYLFCDLKPEALQFKREIIRRGRWVVAHYGRSGLGAVAAGDMAAKLLARLGLIEGGRQGDRRIFYCR